MSDPSQIVLYDPELRDLVGLDDPAQLPSLLQAGYRPATPQELALREQREHYDTALQATAAAGEGALDTFLPVIGPALERALGVTPESQQARAAFHPVARAAGQVGAGVLGAATGLGAPGLFAKAGAGIARGIGGGILGAAAGEAAQGFLYSASDVANRAVMQDPSLTAEAALREVGISTAIGGGLGALGGLARKIAADHAEQWEGDLQDFAADRLNKVYGGIQTDRNQLVKKYGEAGYLQRMREIAQDPGLRPGPFDNPAALHEKAGAVLDDAWKAMKAELDKAGEAGATVSGDDLLQRFRAVIDATRDNPWAQGAARRLDEALGGYEKLLAGKEIPLDAVHALRKQISSQIGYARGVVDFDSNLAKNAMHDFRNAMSDTMDEGFAKSGVGSDAWRAANRRYELASIAQRLAQRGINRSEGNNFVSLTELLTGGMSAMAHGPDDAISHILGRGLVGTAAAALVRRQGSNALFWLGDRASKYLGDLHAGIEGEVSKAVEGAFAGVAGISAVKAADLFTPENFSERSAAINQHLADPQKFALREPALDSFAAPVMEQMRARVLAATQMLGGQIPKYDVSGPLDPQYQPSRTDLARLNRYAEVARDPLAVLARLSEGTILPDHVQALDAMWPAYGSIIRMKAAEQLTARMAKGEPFPHRLRFGLALLLGQDLGRSTTGAAIAAAQAAYASRTPNPQGPPPPGSRASSRMVRNVETKTADRMATSTDAAARHLQERA